MIPKRAHSSDSHNCAQEDLAPVAAAHGSHSGHETDYPQNTSHCVFPDKVARSFGINRREV